MASKRTRGARRRNGDAGRASRVASPNGGGANGAGTTSGRAWTIVSFADLESWRVRRGLPKRVVADMLGVTNSTYHNWARGIAVAMPSTQQRIHGLINGGAAAAYAAPGGASAADGVNRAVLESTAAIVNAYVGAARSKLSQEALCALIRDVSRALTAN
jgi:hypothetical protein